MLKYDFTFKVITLKNYKFFFLIKNFIFVYNERDGLWCSMTERWDVAGVRAVPAEQRCEWVILCVTLNSEHMHEKWKKMYRLKV